MNITLEHLPQCQATLHIEVPPEAVGSEREAITRAFLRQARIPGYRPGKAPLALIEKRYQKDIREELESRLLSEGFREGVRRDELNVISITNVRDQAFNSDDSFTFTADLLLAPAFELPEYKGIKVQVARVEVAETDIDAALEDLRRRFADFADLAHTRPLAMGDFAVISYRGEMGGRPLTEVLPAGASHLAANEDFWVRMAPESFLPGFCAGLEGAAIGEARRVDVTIPADFPLAQLRGMQVAYTVDLKAIKEQKLPEIDEGLAQRIEPGKTLAEMRQAIRDELLAHRRSANEESMTNQIVEFLDGNLDFDLPDRLVASETQRQVNDIVQRSQMSGMNEEQIRANQDAIIGSASNQAKVNIKTSFILDEIAKKEKIEPTEQELLRYVAGLASRNRVPLKKFVEHLKKTRSLDRVRTNIRVGKTLDFLRSNASVEEVEPPAPAESGNEAGQSS